tara:strand:+ start:36 stop:143 length:108 start_codon:yes stop_codon:yes gene_type:complete
VEVVVLIEQVEVEQEVTENHQDPMDLFPYPLEVVV